MFEGIFDEPDYANHILYSLYIKEGFAECLKLIDLRLERNYNKLSEYPLHLKGVILRHQGKLKESLKCFQSSLAHNINKSESLKQIAKSLLLMGKHKSAIKVYDEVISSRIKDREVLNDLGICYSYLHDYDQAVEHFTKANAIQPQEEMTVNLCKAYLAQNDIKSAIKANLEGLKVYGNSTELLRNLGNLFLKSKDYHKALDAMNRSVAEDPNDISSIFAVASITQEMGNVKESLVKYTGIFEKSQDSSEIWNNIGMCLFSEKKYAQSICCLKKALRLDPFSWETHYNLGLAYMNAEQYASASIHLSAAININKKNSASWMYFAYVLEKLGNVDSADRAYENSLKLEDTYQCHLNYAISLANRGEVEKAKVQYKKFKSNLDRWDSNDINSETTQASNDLMCFLKNSCSK